MEFGKRIAIEKEIDSLLAVKKLEEEKSQEERKEAGTSMPEYSYPPSNVIFDESGIFIIYSSILGIKCIHFHFIY